MSIRYCPQPGCHKPYYPGQTCHRYPHSEGLLAVPPRRDTLLRAEMAEEIREERLEREVREEMFVAEVAEEIVEDTFFGGDGW